MGDRDHLLIVRDAKISWHMLQLSVLGQVRRLWRYLAIAHNFARIRICALNALTVLIEWLQFFIGSCENITLALLGRNVAILIVCLDHPLFQAGLSRVVLGCLHARLPRMYCAEHISLLTVEIRGTWTNDWTEIWLSKVQFLLSNDSSFRLVATSQHVISQFLTFLDESPVIMKWVIDSSKVLRGFLRSSIHQGCPHLSYLRRQVLVKTLVLNFFVYAVLGLKIVDRVSHPFLPVFLFARLTLWIAFFSKVKLFPMSCSTLPLLVHDHRVVVCLAFVKYILIGLTFLRT